MSLNRTIAPALAELSTDYSITPEVTVLPSGARMHTLQNSIQPVVRIEFVFKAGKWYQPKTGVASLTAKMLKEGTTQKSAKQIADMVDFYGASLDVAHGFDRATVTLYCLSKFLPSLLPLAFEIMQSPTFPEGELELMKQRVVQSLAVDKQKNSYLATESFTAGIYGSTHPYATVISEEEIVGIQVQDLVSFHKKAYHLSSAEVFVTGDISTPALDILVSHIEGNKGESIQEPAHTEAPATSGLNYMPSPNEMQASLRIGKPIIRPSHKDYPALYLLNHILGGYFGSRLMKNIREDKGFTYGIYSSLSHKEKASLFSIGTDIKGDKVEETLTEVLKEITLLKNEEVSSEELATAKKHLDGKFLSDHSTIFDKMDKYKSNIYLDLPPDFYSQLLSSMKELSAQDLKAVANQYLEEEALLQVVTGGQKK